MTVLAALAGYYDRLARDGEAPVPGYSAENISFAILFDGRGAYVDTQDLRIHEKGRRPRPVRIVVPQPPADRTGLKIVPGLFWDPAGYALGLPKIEPGMTQVKIEAERKRAGKKFAAFRYRHASLVKSSNDARLHSFLEFLEAWQPERIGEARYWEELPSAQIVFRLDGPGEPFIHDTRAATEIISRERSADAGSPVGMCLVTGEMKPIERLHPSISGFRDADKIVSFNETAFES